MDYRDKFSTILKWTKENPNHTRKIIVCGFLFCIHWDVTYKWFSVTMYYSPRWAHNHSFCAYTEESFYKYAEDEIKESMVIFKNGGHFNQVRERG